MFFLIFEEKKNETSLRHGQRIERKVLRIHYIREQPHFIWYYAWGYLIHQLFTVLVNDCRKDIAMHLLL